MNEYVKYLLSLLEVNECDYIQHQEIVWGIKIISLKRHKLGTKFTASLFFS